MNLKKDLPPIPKPGNVKLNPVVFRYQQWKQDKWALLQAAQDERQRLMLEIAQRQKTVKELTAIIEEHQPTQQS